MGAMNGRLEITDYFGFTQVSVVLRDKKPTNNIKTKQTSINEKGTRKVTEKMHCGVMAISNGINSTSFSQLQFDDLIQWYNTHISRISYEDILSMNKVYTHLVVVYLESVNLIGYITRRLSADSVQL